MQRKLHIMIVTTLLTSGAGFAAAQVTSTPNAGTTASGSAAAGLSAAAAADFCAGDSVLSSDKVNCRQQMQAATTDAQRGQIRQTFLARASGAGSTSGSTAGSTSGAAPRPGSADDGMGGGTGAPATLGGRGADGNSGRSGPDNMGAPSSSGPNASGTSRSTN